MQGNVRNMVANHDMGGRPAGRIDREEHELSHFDRRVDALYVLLTGRAKGVLTMDEVRRMVESFDTADYCGLSYYERWLKAIALLLLEKGLIDRLDVPGANA